MSRSNSEIDFISESIVFRPIDEMADERERAELVGLITAACDHAAQLLDRIVIGHKNFTLHNAKHARSIIDLMGWFIHLRWEDVTPIESAVLIISAYWHDIGMLNDPDGKPTNINVTQKNLKDRLEWEPFNELHGQSARESGISEAELISKYIRWCHADRVTLFLDDFDPDDQHFIVGGYNYKELIRDVCRSHHIPIEKISQSGFLSGNYNDVDAFFCALCLRICDILDFSRRRAPKPDLSWLLEHGSIKQNLISRMHWEMHTVSFGFKFPEHSDNPHADKRGEATQDGRAREFLLEFSAQPRSPEIELAINNHLSVIEDELKACLKFRKDCRKNKYREFPFPEKIDRSGIIPFGYVSGDYGFKLDHSQVLNLVSGRQLYKDNFVFLRELLQNAIDTVRFRLSLGDDYMLEPLSDGSIQPIQVDSFRDSEDFFWVVISDYGMGMSEEVLREFFLSVGVSYYSSRKFLQDCEQIASRGSTSTKMIPISRFGIGVVSCFLVSDRVEVFTRSRLGEKVEGKNLALSLNGLNSIFTLRAGTDAEKRPIPWMKDGTKMSELAQAKSSGTVLGVRINPGSEEINFNLRNYCSEHISSCPIEIFVNGRALEDTETEFFQSDWIDDADVDLPFDLVSKLREELHYPFTKAFTVRRTRLDLTENSASPNFLGQIAVVGLHGCDDWREFTRGLDGYCTVEVRRHVVRQKILDPSPQLYWKLLLRVPFYLQDQEFMHFDGDEGSSLRMIISEYNRFKHATVEADSAGWVISNVKGQRFAEKAISLGPFSLSDIFQEVGSQRIRKIETKPYGNISHNGIAIPPAVIATTSAFSKVVPFRTASSFVDNSNNLFLSSSDVNDGDFVWGRIGLKDSYRPDLELSRDRLRGLPVDAYADGLLSLLQALSRAGLENCVRDHRTLTSFAVLPTLKGLSYIELQRSEAANRAEWDDIPMFGVSDKSESPKLSYSVKFIRKLVEEGYGVVLADSLTPFSAGTVQLKSRSAEDPASFFSYLWSYLATSKFEIKLASISDMKEFNIIDGQRGSILARGKQYGAEYRFIVATATRSTKSVSVLESLLPPLFMLPFVDQSTVADIAFGLNKESKELHALIKAVDRLTAVAESSIFDAAGELALNLKAEDLQSAPPQAEHAVNELTEVFHNFASGKEWTDLGERIGELARRIDEFTQRNGVKI